MFRSRVGGGAISPRRLFRRCQCRGRDFRGGLRIDLQELAQHLVRIEPDHVRVRSNVGAPEDSRRPVRDVVPLEPLEQRELDFGVVGDGAQGNLSFFTPLAQAPAETLRHEEHLSRSYGSEPTVLKIEKRHCVARGPEGRSPLSLGRGGPMAVKGNERGSESSNRVIRRQHPTLRRAQIPVPGGA